MNIIFEKKVRRNDMTTTGFNVDVPDKAIKAFLCDMEDMDPEEYDDLDYEAIEEFTEDYMEDIREHFSDDPDVLEKIDEQISYNNNPGAFYGVSRRD